jgi:multiple sugar transport system substrate-binding protein
MKDKRILWSSVFLLFTLLLSACGGDSGSSSSGTVTLRYSIWDKNQAPALQKMIDTFEKTHTTIKVNLEVTPWDQYWTKLDAAATAGTTADLFWMNNAYFIKYAANGILAPLNDQIAKDKVDLGVYPQSLVDAYSYAGKHYALPKDFDTVGLWYNKKLFDGAGLKYPDSTWTWQTFQEAAKKLTDPAKGTWGFTATTETQAGYYNAILQNGGYIISDDKKKSGYDQPAAIEAIKFWTDLIKNKYSPSLAQMTDTTFRNLFESGKVGMIFDGSWAAVEYNQNEYTKNNVDVSVLPQGKQRATIIAGLGTMISANTQHPQEAWELEKFLGSKDAADINASSGIGMPAYQDTQSAWVKSMPQFHLQNFVGEVSYAHLFPVTLDTAAWMNEETPFITKIWTGELSPEDGLKQAAQKINAALAKQS